MTKERLIEKKIYLERRKAQKRNKTRICCERCLSKNEYICIYKLDYIPQKKGFISKEYINKSIIVPRHFSFEDNSDDSIYFF